MKTNETKMGCGTTLSYLFMVAVMDFSVTSYLLNQVPSNSMNYGLYSGMTIWFFAAPAFLVGFFLFAALDWGFKKLWKERAVRGLLAIGFALAVPFLLPTFNIRIDSIMIPIAISVTMLLWSGFVVAMQIWFE